MTNPSSLRFPFGPSIALILVTSPAYAEGPTAAPPAKPPTKQECVTANEAAQDQMHAGKFHDARASVAVCLATSCPRPLREDCAQKLAEIESAVPTVVFVAKDAASNDLSAVHVKMDGQPFLDRLEGATIAIDPGEHHFGFQAEGFRPIETTVVLREGDKKRRVMVFLEPITAPVAPPPPLTVVRPASHEGSPGSTQRTIGLAVGGAGVAWLVVGSVYGLLTKQTYDHSTTEATPRREADYQLALNQARIANVAFAAGGVLLAGGAVLFFSAPGGKTTTGLYVAPIVGDRGGGVGLRGTW